MSKRQLKLLIALIVTLLLGGGGAYSQRDDIGRFLTEQQPGLYTVVTVEDGDTITVDMNGKAERVRFIGVDTPELHHPQKPVQCFAEAARIFTTELIGQNQVRLEADILDDNRDIYQRLLRYVYLPDGRLVNQEIITQGYGFAYTHFPFQKKEQFRAEERQAREENKGLWSGCQIKEDADSRETNPAS